MSTTNRCASHSFIFAALLLVGCEAERADTGNTPTFDGSTLPPAVDGSSAPGDGGPAAADGDGGSTTGDGGSTTDQDGSDGEPTHYTREACELVSTAAGDGPAGTLNLVVEVVVQGLEIPWGLAWLPNGDLLVTERPGRLRRIRGGQLEATPVLEVDVAEVSFLEELGLGSEGGLLGVVLHPEFASNRLFFMYYTARGANNALINRLGEYELAQDGSSAAFQRLLLDDIPSGLHHQGGRMHIGPDGKLYVGVGAYDPALAQQPDEQPGKLLRMNLDGSVPDDNPTPGSLVFLTGVRNTQGYDWFDDDRLRTTAHRRDGSRRASVCDHEQLRLARGAREMRRRRRQGAAHRGRKLASLSADAGARAWSRGSA